MFSQSAFDFMLISFNTDNNLKYIQVCVSCSNGFQTIYHEILEINYKETKNLDEIPTKIFMFENLNFSVKIKDVETLSIASPKQQVIEIIFCEKS